jgi:hypothetical protein
MNVVFVSSRAIVSLNGSLHFGQPIESFRFRFKVLMRRILSPLKAAEISVVSYFESSPRPVDEVQKLLETLRSDSDEADPGSSAAAPE